MEGGPTTQEYIQQPADQMPGAETGQLTSFLERHGSTLIENHEGQMVSVSEAVANCKPFARLVKIMGEEAISLMAGPKNEAAQKPVKDKDATQDKLLARYSNTAKEETAIASEEVQNAHQKRDQISPAASPKIERRLPPDQYIYHQALLDKLKDDQKISSEKHTAQDSEPPAVKVESKSAIIEEPISDVPVAEKTVTLPFTKKSVAEFKKPVTIQKTLPDQIAVLRPIIVVEPEPIKDTVALEENSEPLTIVRPEVDKDDVAEDNLQTAIIDQPETMTESTDVIYVPTDNIESAPTEFIIEETENQPPEVEFHPATETSFEHPEYETDENPEPAESLAFPDEEVEHFILMVAEEIEGLDADTKEAALRIMDKIFQIISEAQAPLQEQNPDIPDDEDEPASENLTVLFTELFETVGIEYSQECLEACVKLALEGSLNPLPAKMGLPDREKPSQYHHAGTHEILRQMLVSLGRIRPAFQHAYEIGKSAVSSCCRQFAAA